MAAAAAVASQQRGTLVQGRSETLHGPGGPPDRLQRREAAASALGLDAAMGHTAATEPDPARRPFRLAPAWGLPAASPSSAANSSGLSIAKAGWGPPQMSLRCRRSCKCPEQRSKQGAAPDKRRDSAAESARPPSGGAAQ